ncbi:MAG: 3-oxoacyl-[acyl-carrier-protein] synthase III C-terminal domain-containing protein [Paenirhodobacter sp.]|uniref:3-oxoacyl-[acyl-carrier-protein] synthase III C-terminal domain-containing protein n=1 Tax=Paenirhodobacter sp. TaxID=1965326 RepID=UPI003D0D6A16
MLSILDVELAFPARTERLGEISAELGLSRNQTRMFDRFFGFDRFHHDPDESQQALIGAAVAPLLKRNAAAAERLGHVGHCHTLPATTLFEGVHSDILAPFAGSGAEVFSATMNHCATGITLLGAMERLLAPGQTGLIVIAEKAFHPDIRLIENTTIMGEGCAAVLVGPGQGRFDLIGVRSCHLPQFWQNSGHRNEGFLDGFDEAYLPFAIESLRSACAQYGVAAETLRFVLPHNVNFASWLQIANALGLRRDQLWLETIGRVGHCFGADPFINLIEAERAGRLRAGDRVALFSIGLGATAACALLEVAPRPQ